MENQLHQNYLWLYSLNVFRAEIMWTVLMLKKTQEQEVCLITGPQWVDKSVCQL